MTTFGVHGRLLGRGVGVFEDEIHDGSRDATSEVGYLEGELNALIILFP